jgi:DNA-binding XRE family transcriptional regulator
MKNGKKRPRVEFTSERIDTESAIEATYQDNPSLNALRDRGDLDQEAYERVKRMRDEGPRDRPFGELLAALRSERERQGLSLADIAQRSGMDRAAIHKLEIGLNKNPTWTTVARYADALGKRIEVAIKDKVRR